MPGRLRSRLASLAPPARRAGWLILWGLSELAIVAGLAYLPAVFFWRLLTSSPSDQAIIPIGDFTELHFPYRSWAAEQLGGGRLPAWNPYLSAGHPSLGDVQFGLLYPIGWAFASAWGGDLSYFALEQQVILHFSIAAVGTYLFARVAGAGRAGSILAALVFAFGGYMTSFPVQQIIILQTSAWLPWILLGLELAIGRREPLAGLIIAAATAMAALVGHPQTLAYVLGAAAVFGLYRLATRPSLGGLIAAPAGGLIGLALAAPALLPALEHLRLTARTDVGYQFTAHGYAPHELLGLIFPTDLGGRALYVGGLVLALALVGAASRRSGVGFWAGLVAFALLLSLGGNAFLYPAAYALVPGLQYFRDHERAAVLVNLGLGMLAAYGLHFALAAPRRASARAGWGATGSRLWAPDSISAGALCALALGAAFGLFGLFLQYGVVVAQGDLRNQLRGLGDRAFLSALFALLAAALLFAVRARAARPILLGAAAVLLVGVDLFTAGWTLNLAPGSPDGILRPNQTTRFLVERSGPLDRVSTEGHLPADGNTGALFRIPDLVGNSPLDLQAYRVFGEKVDEFQRWRMLNVRYVVTRRKLEDPRLPLVFQENDLMTYELRRDLRLPRAWLVHRAIVAPSRDDELELTRRIKPEEEVVVDRPLGPLDGRPPDRAVGEATEVALVAYDPERLLLRSWSRRDAVLVLGERDYPGWRAIVDGQSAPLARANYLLRGLYLPAGVHEIELRFDPPGFAAGRELARQALAWAILLVALRLLLPPLLWSGRRAGVILADRIRARARPRTVADAVSEEDTATGVPRATSEPEPSGGAR
ncbi:MAG TPA: hypothetical protein VGM69_24480 [Chloroflexota bacterium]|jgi:hypothetical protein